MGVIKQQTFQCGPAAPCTACTDGIRWSAMKFPRNQHLLLVKSKRFTIKVNLNFPGHWVIWWKWWNVHEISLKCPFFRMILQKSAWNQPETSLKSAGNSGGNSCVGLSPGWSSPPVSCSCWRTASWPRGRWPVSPSKTTTYRYSHPGVDRILSIYLSISLSLSLFLSLSRLTTMEYGFV